MIALICVGAVIFIVILIILLCVCLMIRYQYEKQYVSRSRWPMAYVDRHPSQIERDEIELDVLTHGTAMSPYLEVI